MLAQLPHELFARGAEHDPLLRPLLQRILRRGVEIVTFLSTGDPEAFRMPGTRFLQLPLGTVEQVHLPIGATA